MNLKKIVCAGLAGLLIFFSMPVSPTGAANAPSKESLLEFLKTTDKIEAKMEYPSMLIASNVRGKVNSVKLPAMTPLVIRAVETISTKDIVSGSVVNFAVVSDVKDKNGNVLIRAGAPVSAQISFAKKRSFVGIAGDLTVSDFHVTAVDGTYVPLVGNVSQKGDDKVVLTVVLSVLICPFFLFMKGEDAKLPAGTTKPAYTATDVFITP
ncbi:MAG: hypothetical protein KH321_00320 [Clostridium sp.]|nr:hypothetical protein [Clostridium sp.]